MKNPICPNCGAELMDDEFCDSILEDDFIANYIAGHCPTCDKEFRWVEVYDYTGVEGLEEVT